MSFLRRVTIPFAALGLLAACADTPRPTEVAAPPTPAFNFMNGPSNAGLHILRDQSWTGFAIDDPTSGIFTILDTADWEFGCTELTEVHFADMQTVIKDPNDPLSAAVHKLLTSKDIFITVYSGAIEDVVDCADLASRKIAQGTGAWRMTDSDYFTWIYPHNNWDAFGISAQGVLTLLAGGTTQFNAVQRCAWNGSDFATLRCTSKVNLT